MADDDDGAPPVLVKAETVDAAADAHAEDKNGRPKQPGGVNKNEEEGTPVSPFKIKDLEAGRSVVNGPTFKDQVHHTGGLLLRDGTGGGGGVGSKSDVLSESPQHISNSSSSDDGNIKKHHRHGFHPVATAAPVLFPFQPAQQNNNNEPEELTAEIPFVDNVAVLIPETQIRNEQQIDHLQHRLAQAEDDKKKQKRRICYIVASVLVTLLGLLLGIFLGILPRNDKATKMVKEILLRSN
jgi:hypothetical protein